MIYIIGGLAAAAIFIGASIMMFLWGLQATVDHFRRTEQDDDES